MSCVIETGEKMKIKNSLKIWRAKKDITQQQLSDAVQLSRQTINSIEKGKFVPSVLSALKLARYFETSVDEIFVLDDDSNN